jgi:hypothetical protein
MRGLICRYPSANPRSRPSFESIFGEFEDCGFAILPGVDPEAVKRSVDGVLALYRRSAHQKT